MVRCVSLAHVDPPALATSYRSLPCPNRVTDNVAEAVSRKRAALLQGESPGLVTQKCPSASELEPHATPPNLMGEPSTRAVAGFTRTTMVSVSPTVLTATQMRSAATAGSPGVAPGRAVLPVMLPVRASILVRIAL